jgi:hypothetical protein
MPVTPEKRRSNLCGKYRYINVLNNARFITIFVIRRKRAGLDPFFGWVRIFVVWERF